MRTGSLKRRIIIKLTLLCKFWTVFESATVTCERVLVPSRAMPTAAIASHMIVRHTCSAFSTSEEKFGLKFVYPKCDFHPICCRTKFHPILTEAFILFSTKI